MPEPITISLATLTILKYVGLGVGIGAGIGVGLPVGEAVANKIS
jgi:hypothetical protein